MAEFWNLTGGLPQVDPLAGDRVEAHVHVNPVGPAWQLLYVTAWRAAHTSSYVGNQP
jgi:hypothetical protein